MRLASPANGSGTLTSMIAGKLCAETVVDIIENKGDFTKVNLWQFNHRYQTEFGVVLAGFYLSQKMIRTLSETDVQNTIKYRLLRPKDVVRVHLMQPVKIGVVDGISRFFHSIPVMPLLFRVLGTGIKIETILKHYKNYPEHYDEAVCNRWQSKRRAIMGD